MKNNHKKATCEEAGEKVIALYIGLYSHEFLAFLQPLQKHQVIALYIGLYSRMKERLHLTLLHPLVLSPSISGCIH